MVRTNVCSIIIKFIFIVVSHIKNGGIVVGSFYRRMIQALSAGQYFPRYII